MAVYAGARQVQVLIGGVDFTPVFLSGEGSDSHWDESGLIKTQFRLRFQMRAGFPRSLDDRENLNFYYRGQEVRISVASEAGVLVRHPRGALRLLNSEYDPATQTLEIEAGCLLSLYSGREATDPTTLATDIEAASDYGEILELIMSELGIDFILTEATVFKVAAPLQVKGGSLLATAGEICTSLGLVGWIDDEERFKVKDLPVKAPRDINIYLGQDEINKARLQGAEPPPQKIVLSGSSSVRVPGANTGTIEDSSTEEIGDGGAIAPELAGTPYILSRLVVLDQWNLTGSVRTRTETRYEPRGMVNPKSPTLVPGNKATLAIREIKTTVETYELDAEGRLLTRVVTCDRPRSLACQNFTDFHANNNTADWQATLGLQSDSLVSPAERITETYSYDPTTGLLSRKLTVTEATYDAILGASQEDWQAWYDTYGNWPEDLRVGEERRETYAQTRGQQLRQTEIRQPYAAAFPEAASTADPPLDREQKVALRLVRSPREYSNSGQLQPPAPERAPLLYDFEDKQVSRTLGISYDGGFGRPREQAIAVPYLVGQKRIYDALGSFKDEPLSGSASPDEQLKRLGRRISKIIVGRFYGEQIILPMRDDLCGSYEPFLGLSLNRNGAAAYYGMDGTSWALEPDRSIVSTDGIWYGGIRADGTEIEPSRVIEPLESAFELTASLAWIPGDPAASYGLTQAIEYAPRVSQSFGVNSAFELAAIIQQLEEVEDVSFTGLLTLTSECNNPQKAGLGKRFVFDSFGTFTVNITPGIGLSTGAVFELEPGPEAIAVYRWNNITGKFLYSYLPETGGSISFVSEDNNYTLSIEGKLLATGTYIEMCIDHSGNAITPINDGVNPN